MAELYDLAGVSGKSVMEHPECKRMMADIRSGHVSGLIFSKLARLCRNKRELEDFAEFFRVNNADMISVQERIDTSTPAGRLFYTLMAAMAQFEREETVDRVKASILTRAKLGGHTGGAAPYGYQWKDKKLVHDPKEAPVRQLMYELFLKHRRKKTVVRLLNEAGHRTRKGVRFTSKTLTRLLQDTTAKGVHRANYTMRNGTQWTLKPESEWHLHEVERLVSDETWDECNRLIDDSFSKQKRPAKKPVHIFAGVAHCECGEKMYVPSNSPKYVCRACRNKIAIADLDAIYMEEIKDYSLSPESIANYLKSSNETGVEKERLLSVQREELGRVEKEIRRTYDLYQQEKIDADGFSKFYQPLQEQRKQLEASIPRLEAELDILKVNSLSAEEVASQAANLYQRWQKMEPEAKRELVEIITDKIVIGKGEITISLCYAPSSKDMAKRWRRAGYLNPFCHLVIKAVRYDSHPRHLTGEALKVALLDARTRLGLTRHQFAEKLRISMVTLCNWEHGRTKPHRQLWKILCRLTNQTTQIAFNADPLRGSPLRFAATGDRTCIHRHLIPARREREL